MSYFKTDPFAYARKVANQYCSSLYYTGSFDDPELPDPDNFRNGDVIVHFNEVYIKMGSWTKLMDNRYNPDNSYDYEYEVEFTKETDTTQWVALLEE